MLAAAIAQSLTLRVIHLHHLEPEDAGVMIICQAVLANVKVSEFILSQSHFIQPKPGSAGIHVGALDNPGLGEPAANALSKLLAEHPSLTTVDFRGTQLGSLGVAAIARAFSRIDTASSG